MNTEKEKILVPNASKKSWAETLKHTLPEVKTSETKKKPKKKKKKKVSTNTEITAGPLVPNATKILQKKPKPQQTAF